MQPNESFYLLNHEVNNPNALGKATPLNANVAACDMESMPSGENYNVLRHLSKITNECYYGTYNSNGVPFLSRLNGNGECQIVYEGDCLDFSPDPKHEVVDWRVDLDVNYQCSQVPTGILKRLVWVDGRDVIYCVDVEASILTESFTTPFFQRCADDPCDFIKLCVPEPKGCLVGEFIPFQSSDLGLSNYMLDKGFKFMYRYVYYDGRASEWSDRSSLYFQDTKGCFDNSEGYPRCMKFRIPIGNPMVDVIEFAFSDDGGLTYNIYERIEKYKKYNSTQQYWYDRDLAENVSSTFSEEDCSFDYIFCNDKEKTTIAPIQISRLYNPMPRSPQGLIRVKEMLGFYNYIKGNCPIDKIQTEKFSVALNCPPISDCKTEFAQVKIRAIVHNTAHDRNQFVYREGTGVDDITDTAKFGGLNPALSGAYEDPIPYDQFFDGEIRNFIAYIEGTDYWAEMKQWHAGSHWSDRTQYGIVGDIGEEQTRNSWRKDSRRGNFFYQEAIFNVPRGTKGFVRLASQHAEGNEQDTSTFVFGVYDDLGNYVGDQDIDGHIAYQSTEIYFDTCDGDQDISSAFVIRDNAVDAGFANSASAYYGYLKDDDGRPIEGALVYPNTNDELTVFTDHNGFFDLYYDDGLDEDVDLHFQVELNCGDFMTSKTVIVGSEHGMGTNVGIVRISDDDNSFYTDDAYLSVKVKVEDCDGVGVSGIRVALSGSKYTTTISNGIATFKIRNYYSRNRSVRAVIVDHNGCFSLDCNGDCNPCFDTPTAATPECYIDPTGQVLTLSPIRINKVSATTNRKGLKNGGRYPFAIVVQGDCGRISAAYDLALNDGYIDIPKAQESGAVRFCDFTYDGTGMVLPDWATSVKIVRGANINPFELQWLVDSIERTDDGKIKLTIQSLNDYNAQYFFKTNTVYQWLKNDRVEFTRKHDGTIIDASISGILNYQTISPFNDEDLSGVDSADDVNYFNQLLIEDDGRLDDIEEGAVIELQRPKVSSENFPYFEICVSIPVENGALVYPTGTFSTFDTYLVNRTIDRFPSQLFEHHSPSDFWGERITDVGKAHFINKYENEKRYLRNITLASPTQINYFGDFEKTFDCLQHGGVISVSLKDDKIGLIISENDNSLFQVADDLLRLGSDNIVRATPTDSLISNPEAKLIGEFGCSYADIGSILFFDGGATWIDSKNDGYIIHNYSYAKKAGTGINQQGNIVTQCNSFFQRTITLKENFNKTSTDFLNHYRYATGQNKITNAIYLTLKALRHSGINNAKATYDLPNSTIAYNPKNDTFLTFISPTPEAFSQLNINDEQGCAILMFQNSIPYITPVVTVRYNVFFEVHTDWLVGITVNAGNKIIVPISCEEQTTQMFFVHKVTTDKVNFVSEVPPKRVIEGQNNKWNFAMLNNVNSRGGLYNGENARGYYCNILFIRDNTLALAYNSIDNTKREKYSELDNILIKFMASEQAGYDQNL